MLTMHDDAEEMPCQLECRRGGGLPDLQVTKRLLYIEALLMLLPSMEAGGDKRLRTSGDADVSANTGGTQRGGPTVELPVCDEPHMPRLWGYPPYRMRPESDDGVWWHDGPGAINLGGTEGVANCDINWSSEA